MAKTRRSKPASIEGPRIAFMLAVLALLMVGLVMVYSASSVSAVTDGISGLSSVASQIICVGVGVVLAVVIWRWIPTGFWQGLGMWVLWGIAMVMLVLTFVAGTASYGAQRWLSIGPISIQPSEFAKIALLLVAVRIIAEWRTEEQSLGITLLKGLIFVLLPLLFLYKAQSDLGTTLICVMGIIAVMIIGGVSAAPLAILAAIVLAFGLYAVFGTDYRSGRMVYLNPWDDGQNGYGDGYNIIRSYYALAEGGIFGVGLGNSHEKYSYLFASDSDFIFAVIGEELGLLGALAVIGLYLVLLLTGLALARRASNLSSKMLAGGCTIMIVGQAFLNIGCVIGVLPTTGKPLPLISSGGSSALATLIMVGIILSISREAAAPSVYERRRDDLAVVSATRRGRDYQPSGRLIGFPERSRTVRMAREYDGPSMTVVSRDRRRRRS